MTLLTCPRCKQSDDWDPATLAMETCVFCPWCMNLIPLPLPYPSPA